MAITIDVKKGDTILVGKFKNKKMVIKDIGVDKHGMPPAMEEEGCPHWECLCAIARPRPDWNPCVAGWATWQGEGSSLGSDQAVQSQRAGLFQFSGRGFLEIECGPSLIIDS